MIEIQEVLVIENTGEVLEDRVVETLVATEIQQEFIDVAMQGPPGFAGGPIVLENDPIEGVSTVGFFGEVDNGDSGATATIVLALGQKQKIRLTHATPVLIFNTEGAPVGHYQLRIIEDGVGGRIPSYVGLSASRWLGSATQPNINGAANGESILSLFWDGQQFTQALTKVGAA
jgi:hypothetical protein